MTHERLERGAFFCDYEVNMKDIELLAPAGSMETLIAAVNAGANAIYLGGKAFGARRSAQNFTNEELIVAIRYCHERDVSVYVTVNTLIDRKSVV